MNKKAIFILSFLLTLSFEVSRAESLKYNQCNSSVVSLRMQSDTLIIPFGIGWGGGSGNLPTPTILPNVVKAGDNIYVIHNTSASIPYYIIKNDNNAMMEQGTMNLIPRRPYVIDISKWDDGDYTMYITVAGIQFYGTFSIE